MLVRMSFGNATCENKLSGKVVQVEYVGRKGDEMSKEIGRGSLVALTQLCPDILIITLMQSLRSEWHV